MDPQDQRTPEQIKRDALQDKFAKRFIAIPMTVMMNKELTLADKVVFGRAFGFEFLFESPTQTASILGISPSQVRSSKRKLEKMGLLICTEETFFGKKYQAQMPKFDSPLSKSDNPLVKIKQPPYQNLTTENKERLNGEERLSLKDKSFKEAHEPAEDSEDAPLKGEEPKRYGSAEINDFLDQWEEATGFDWHGVQKERFAAKNLIAKYGSEAMKPLLRRVQAARRSTDQFAPQIAKPSQLVGKYEKLTALTMWEERQQKAQNPTPTPTRPVIEGPQVPRGPVYERDVREDKTEEELRAECQSIREKYKGTKFEHIFNGGRK